MLARIYLVAVDFVKKFGVRIREMKGTSVGFSVISFWLGAGIGRLRVAGDDMRDKEL